MSTCQQWLAMAIRKNIVKRSARVAAIVGSILVFINQADIIIQGNITPVHIVKIILTYCVPYCVSTYASVAAVIEQNDI